MIFPLLDPFFMFLYVRDLQLPFPIILGRLLLSESYVLIHKDNLSSLSLTLNEKDKALLDRLENQPTSTPKYKPSISRWNQEKWYLYHIELTKLDSHEMQPQEWLPVQCSQCNSLIGLKEIPNQGTHPPLSPSISASPPLHKSFLNSLSNCIGINIFSNRIRK